MHYDAHVRTTIDLPEDLHRVASALARDRGQTLSQAVADLIQMALEPGGATEVLTDDRTGLPLVRVGRTLTTEDVRRIDDEP